MVVAVPFATEAAAGRGRAVEPAVVYSSIAACTVGITPAVFGSADTVRLDTTFSPTGTFYRIGADGLGPDLASVRLFAGTSPNSDDVLASVLEATFGLASGTHTLDFYAVDGTGAAMGAPLCTTTYTYDGAFAEPVIGGPVELPHLTAGVSVPDAGTGVVTGEFTYTPTLAGSPQPTGCSIEVVGAADPEGDPLVYGAGVGTAGTDFSGANLVGGLWFQPGDPADDCGTIYGTPTRAATYTLRQTFTYCLGCGVVVGSTSVASVEATQQTYAVRRTLTLVVDPATPRFTG